MREKTKNEPARERKQRQKKTQTTKNTEVVGPLPPPKQHANAFLPRVPRDSHERKREREKESASDE
jgi:hypothetical protein